MAVKHKSGPITTATRMLTGVGEYILTPVKKLGGKADRQLGKVIGHNPEAFDTELAAKKYARLLEHETGKKVRVEKRWGKGWDVVVVANPKNPDGSPAYKAGIAWLKQKARTSKGSFLTTPGAEQYLKKMGYEGTRSIPSHSPGLMYTPAVKARVEKANEMYEDFLNGANYAWDERLRQQHHTDENPRRRNPESDAASMYAKFHGKDVVANPGKLTIYQALTQKLRRTPTNAELKADVQRIKEEALVEAASKGKLAHQRGRRRNPESDAASMYSKFHGKESEAISEFIEEEHYHGNLAALGQLIELKVYTITGLDATFCFDYEGEPSKGVILASNEEGTALYAVGGDQSLDLASVKMDKEDYLKDSMVIGDCYFVSYFTEKDFDKFQPTIYEHELGEETGELPVLRYDSLNERIYIDGGAYVIKKPLMRTSDGIEN
jgi:hypothetical protein